MLIGYDRAVAALKSGDTLFVTMPDPANPQDRKRYTLARGGVSVRATTFRKLFDDLAPVGDGLFGADITQSYRWAGGDEQ